MRQRRVILRADARGFLAAPRPERPFGRKIVRLPIAYGSDQCTTRSYRQTASISVLLISGILGLLRFCTACCRGRCLHRLFCPDSPDCLYCGYTPTVASQTYFFCLARKSRQKDALGDALYCALTRAIFWPLRGLNALFGRRIATIPMAFGSVNVPHAFAGSLR